MNLKSSSKGLVSNAGEALGETGGDVTLRVGSVFADPPRAAASSHDDAATDTSRDEWIFLEVEDSGPGMDEETSRRVFEPFFSTKQTGRGLGLAAVHGIVRRHRGEIQVDTAPGRGTRFRVLFPRANGAVAQRGAAAVGRSEAQADGACVLVVDDDEAILELADEFLKRVGVRTLVALGGAEAIRIFSERSDEIDAVVLDWVMPAVDGAQVLEAIRRIRPDVRVVLMTGYREASARFETASNERSPRHLRKPFEAAELVECVRAVLGEP